MSAVIKKKSVYRTPVRYAQASISLDEFTDDELRAELNHRSADSISHTGLYEGSLCLPEELCSRLATLRLCGRGEAALRELCDYIEPFIGKIAP